MCRVRMIRVSWRRCRAGRVTSAKPPKASPVSNTIRPGKPLPGRVIHFGRLTDRNREPKGDE
ncbi:hypothetical protein I5H37_gp079 [Mycobacterium phage Filuzino]|uniref:Uncharacterized protein n=1 Tax=Mycobacterium phage Filuzino TaxID=2484209 RepID=A0A3G3M033_9CAUD|nr:hypothetical protein I5H37_gp079 [Mycobacterium phage Filuzino]AYQ99453.1 hypothetical protein PBI_FILUZINO_79 [Mycobacterium phage Filuzino]